MYWLLVTTCCLRTVLSQEFSLPSNTFHSVYYSREWSPHQNHLRNSLSSPKDDLQPYPPPSQSLPYPPPSDSNPEPLPPAEPPQRPSETYGLPPEESAVPPEDLPSNAQEPDVVESLLPLPPPSEPEEVYGIPPEGQALLSTADDSYRRHAIDLQHRKYLGLHKQTNNRYAQNYRNQYRPSAYQYRHRPNLPRPLRRTQTDGSQADPFLSIERTYPSPRRILVEFDIGDPSSHQKPTITIIDPTTLQGADFRGKGSENVLPESRDKHRSFFRNNEDHLLEPQINFESNQQAT